MKTIIQHVKLYDGQSTVLEDASLAFDERGILAVSKQIIVPEEPTDIVIDGTGKTVLPGLFDCHVHLGGLSGENQVECGAIAADQLREYLRFGITTVRGCGSRFNADILVRDMERAGRITGARVVASGLCITTTGGHAWAMGHQCDTVDEVRKAARIQLREGADQVKLMASGGMGTKGSDPDMSQMSVEEMRAAVEEAEKRGALSCAHATGLGGAQCAIEAGVRSIEHTQLTPELCELMIRHGTWYCSTITTRYGIVNSTDPSLEWMRKKARPTDIENMLQAIRYCRAYGIPMAAGTDSGVSDLICPLGTGLYRELWLYTEAGLTPEEALRTATGNAAILCGLQNETGTLRQGLAADVILIDGDPLRDIRRLANVCMTFHRGRRIY